MTNTKDELLGKAIKIAIEEHYDTYDKSGAPYILHPLHLMNQFMFDKELAMIAVLHDVVEDSDITLDDLADEGFNNRVLCAVGLLTHEKGVSYEDYIEKIGTNFDAIRVKRKDLEHNSDITRLKGVTDKDFARIKKYHRAFTRLGELKTSGGWI